MNRPSIPISECSKLAYVQRVPNDGRIVFLLPYYNADAKEWVFNIPVAEGELGRLAGGEPVVSTYFATAPANPATDYAFPLGTFVAQHLSFPGVVGALQRIESDIYQFCAVLEKYHLIADQSGKRRHAELLYASELEYLVILVRSLHDLLQRLSKHAAALVHSLDEPRHRLITDLPDSFAQLALHGDRACTAAEITERFGLPAPLAQFYQAEADRFRTVRNLRNDIEHHGETVPIIFHLAEGAAVSPGAEPWNKFPIWRPEHLRGNDLGSLRLLFAHLIQEALDMTTRYTAAYASCVAVPGALSDGVYLFLRHPFSHYLVSLDRIFQQPWENAAI